MSFLVYVGLTKVTTTTPPWAKKRVALIKSVWMAAYYLRSFLVCRFELSWGVSITYYTLDSASSGVMLTLWNFHFLSVRFWDQFLTVLRNRLVLKVRVSPPIRLFMGLLLHIVRFFFTRAVILLCLSSGRAQGYGCSVCYWKAWLAESAVRLERGV